MHFSSHQFGFLLFNLQFLISLDFTDELESMLFPDCVRMEALPASAVCRGGFLSLSWQQQAVALQARSQMNVMQKEHACSSKNTHKMYEALNKTTTTKPLQRFSPWAGFQWKEPRKQAPRRSKLPAQMLVIWWFGVVSPRSKKISWILHLAALWRHSVMFFADAGPPPPASSTYWRVSAIRGGVYLLLLVRWLWRDRKCFNVSEGRRWRRAEWDDGKTREG